MEKKPFVSKEKLEEIIKEFPTPFHLYDEKGIRKNAKALKEAFAWNPGYKEYFAVKATPNPFLIQILKEYGLSLIHILIRQTGKRLGADDVPGSILNEFQHLPG